MSLSDPISDMLTRIRNAVRNRFPEVKIRNNGTCKGIADVLHSEGYIASYDVIDDGKQGVLRLTLKYGPRGEQIIQKLDRISKPGCRRYTKMAELPRPLGGLGIVVLSTSKGIVSDRKARELNIGGELLCVVE